MLDARVHGNQSPSTATIANLPPFVKAFAGKISRRILSHGEATPCVPTQGHLVIPDCPTSQVNAIGDPRGLGRRFAERRWSCGGAGVESGATSDGGKERPQS